MSEWIKCSERTPPNNTPVLLSNGEWVAEGWKGQWSDFYENDYSGLSGVTHWMPLPEPPKD